MSEEAGQAVRTAINYQDLLDNAQDLIQCVDEKGSFLYVNNAWIRKLGYSLQEALTMNFSSVVAAEEQGHAKILLGQMSSSSHASLVQTIFVSKGGIKIPVEGSITVKNDSNGVRQIIAIFRDISEKKEAEDEAKMFSKVAVDRELRMIELKKEVNDLLQQLNKPSKYKKLEV